MRKILGFVLAAALLADVALAQNSAQPRGASASQNTTVRFAPGAILRVELAKSVDARKAKVGDEVIGKTMDDFLGDNNDVLAPKGCRVLGHVAEATPREGESASTLGIAFDKVVLKNGTGVPFKASIQAIGGPDLSAAPANEPMPQSGGGAPTMSPGHDPDSYGGSMGRGGMPASGPLPPNSQGVVGISGMSLSAGTAEDSLLSSQKRNVKLDSGTQMILRVMQ
jgi:hypothetical protein